MGGTTAKACLIENGKKVVLIDLIEGKSSTSIIDKVSKI